MRNYLVVLCICAVIAPTSANADNILFMYNSTSQSVTTTLTNPYTGDTANINGTYNVNNGTYNGNAADFNTLLLTNSSDYLLLDSGGTQTFSEIDRLVMGNGNDVVDLATLNYTIGDLILFGGTGNELIWCNAGNDTINIGASGHNTIDGGPGNDLIVFSQPLSSYTITPTGPNRVTITALNSSTINDISYVESAQFSDQTISLLPEPTSLSICVLACLFAGSRPRRRARTRST